jgi:cell division protein FtsB
MGFLYYRPVKDYISIRHELTQRRAEVHALAQEKATLERRLAASGTSQALIQEARRLGYVHPGEQLFIITGMKQWLKAHRAAAKP